MNPNQNPESLRVRQAAAEAEFYRRQELSTEPVIMDDEDAAAVDLDRALIERMDRHWIRGLRVLAQSEGNRDMELDCFLYAHSLGHLVPVPAAANPKGKPVDMVMLSVKWFGNGGHKQTILKAVNKYRDCLDLPPVPGQRSAEGRKSMSNARKDQLK